MCVYVCKNYSMKRYLYEESAVITGEACRAWKTSNHQHLLLLLCLYFCCCVSVCLFKKNSCTDSFYCMTPMNCLGNCYNSSLVLLFQVVMLPWYHTQKLVSSCYRGFFCFVFVWFLTRTSRTWFMVWRERNRGNIWVDYK